MVELTACMFEDSIPSQYDDSQLVVCFQDWGVFGVKHVTAKKRAHLVDQVGNPVKQCRRDICPLCSPPLRTSFGSQNTRFCYEYILLLFSLFCYMKMVSNPSVNITTKFF